MSAWEIKRAWLGDNANFFVSPVLDAIINDLAKCHSGSDPNFDQNVTTLHGQKNSAPTWEIKRVCLDLIEVFYLS